LNSIGQDEAIPIEHRRTGSTAAFEAVVRKYMKDAYFIALGLVGNPEDALDLSQEAFVRVYKNLHRFNSKQNFFPWFYQILRNLCFSHLRSKTRQRRLFVADADQRQDTAEAADTFSPDVVAQRNETKDRLWAAIGKLEPKHREIIILRHFQNLSYEQMSKALFCNKATVASRLYYARKKLKDMLQNQKGGRQE